MNIGFISFGDVIGCKYLARVFSKAAKDRGILARYMEIGSSEMLEVKGSTFLECNFSARFKCRDFVPLKRALEPNIIYHGKEKKGTIAHKNGKYHNLEEGVEWYISQDLTDVCNPADWLRILSRRTSGINILELPICSFTRAKDIGYIDSIFVANAVIATINPLISSLHSFFKVLIALEKLGIRVYIVCKDYGNNKLRKKIEKYMGEKVDFFWDSPHGQWEWQRQIEGQIFDKYIDANLRIFLEEVLDDLISSLNSM